MGCAAQAIGPNGGGRVGVKMGEGTNLLSFNEVIS